VWHVDAGIQDIRDAVEIVWLLTFTQQSTKRGSDFSGNGNGYQAG
jgi:hypothetical protein